MTAPRIVVLMLAASLTSLGTAASAQTQIQIQGMTAGSPMPRPGPSTGSPKPTRTSCTADGRSQGLRGGKLSAFVRHCQSAT